MSVVSRRHESDPSVPPRSNRSTSRRRLACRSRDGFDRKVECSAAARRAVARARYAVLAIAASLVLVVADRHRLAGEPLPDEPSGRRATTAAAPTAAAPNAPPETVDVESVEAEFRLAEQHYQNAIAKLEQAARLDQAASGGDNALDPQTAAMLQKSLQVIDQAIAESRAALRSEPLSASARDSLFDALKRKVALLQDTIALMNEMRKGNSAGSRADR
jgi:hypothetical protein